MLSADEFHTVLYYHTLIACVNFLSAEVVDRSIGVECCCNTVNAIGLGDDYRVNLVIGLINTENTRDAEAAFGGCTFFNHLEFVINFNLV